MVTSDHLPIDIEEKRIEFDHAAFGSLGLESAFSILNAIFDTETVIRLLTKGRERFGLTAASITEGQPANLSLFTPQGTSEIKKENLRSTSKNSMYVGQKGKGSVYGVIVNNQLILA